jgi:xanthine dehydrogenase accessory factor
LLFRGLNQGVFALLSEDQEIYKIAAEGIGTGQVSVLATIVQTKGSTPRELGAKIVYIADGRSLGSIGGGCSEAEVRRAALDLLQSGGSRLVRADLTGTAEESGMVCGGIMDVFVESVSRNEDARHMAAWGLVRECLAAGEAFCRAAVVEVAAGPSVVAGAIVVVAKGGKSAGSTSMPDLDESIRSEANAIMACGRPALKTVSVSTATGEIQVRVFFDVIATPAKLLVLGGGHISVPLVKIGALLGFYITVVDDRPSFANHERFPEADQVICADFADALNKFEFTPTTYAVIVTRGHQHDAECLRMLINVDLAYLGMIGSKRKVKEFNRLLRDEGVPQSKLDQVRAPIGLAIGAETPEEIAVSILAEIIMVRRLG